jgi:hypothetical protein
VRTQRIHRAALRLCASVVIGSSALGSTITGNVSLFTGGTVTTTATLRGTGVYPQLFGMVEYVAQSQPIGITNGQLRMVVVPGGSYTLTLPQHSTVFSLVIPNDTNTYDLSQVCTNLTTFSYVAPFPGISSRVFPGANLTATTNNLGLPTETLTLNAQAGDGGGVTPGTYVLADTGEATNVTILGNFNFMDGILYYGNNAYTAGYGANGFGVYTIDAGQILSLDSTNAKFGVPITGVLTNFTSRGFLNTMQGNYYYAPNAYLAGYGLNGFGFFTTDVGLVLSLDSTNAKFGVPLTGTLTNIDSRGFLNTMEGNYYYAPNAYLAGYGLNGFGFYTIEKGAVLSLDSTNALFGVPVTGVFHGDGTALTLGLPGPTVLGGIVSTSAVTHKFLVSIGTDGKPTAAQPAFSDLSGTATAAQLPLPTSTAIGGIVSTSAIAHNFVASIGTDGKPTLAQPAFSDVSGTATAAQLPLPTSTTIGGIMSTSAVASKWVGSIGTDGKPVLTQPNFLDLLGALAAGQVPNGLITSNMLDSGTWNLAINLPPAGGASALVLGISGVFLANQSIAASGNQRWTSYFGGTASATEAAMRAPKTTRTLILTNFTARALDSVANPFAATTNVVWWIWTNGLNTTFTITVGAGSADATNAAGFTVQPGSAISLQYSNTTAQTFAGANISLAWQYYQP